MSEKKQIVEEMARHIPARIFVYDVSENTANLDELHREIVACHLYRAGYRKQSEGEWVEKNVFFAIYKCSICGAENLYKDGHAALSNFCPTCGAKMKGA